MSNTKSKRWTDTDKFYSSLEGSVAAVFAFFGLLGVFSLLASFAFLDFFAGR